MISAGPLPALDSGGCTVNAGDTFLAGADGSDSVLSVSLVADMAGFDTGGWKEMKFNELSFIDVDDKRSRCSLQIIT